MPARPRVRPVVTLAVLVTCLLLSAVTLAGIALGLAAAVGAQHIVMIGALVGAGVFVANAAALCMATNLHDGEERTLASGHIASAAPAHARAS